jgi:hypothetical protein
MRLPSPCYISVSGAHCTFGGRSTRHSWSRAEVPTAGHAHPPFAPESSTLRAIHQFDHAGISQLEPLAAYATVTNALSGALATCSRCWCCYGQSPASVTAIWLRYRNGSSSKRNSAKILSRKSRPVATGRLLIYMSCYDIDCCASSLLDHVAISRMNTEVARVFRRGTGKSRRKFQASYWIGILPNAKFQDAFGRRKRLRSDAQVFSSRDIQ